MTIYWYHYYESLWQALATIAIHGICSFILILILCDTLYYFFIIPNNNNDVYKTNNRKRTQSLDEPVPSKSMKKLTMTNYQSNQSIATTTTFCDDYRSTTYINNNNINPAPSS
eukprot:543870_1